jgi:hypothetical protein
MLRIAIFEIFELNGFFITKKHTMGIAFVMGANE